MNASIRLSSISGYLLKRCSGRQGFNQFIPLFNPLLIPIAIISRFGLIALSQLLPFYLILYLTSYLIHFNFRQSVSSVADKGTALFYPLHETAIRARLSIAVLCFSVLFLLKIPGHLLISGMAWCLFRFYNHCYQSTFQTKEKILRSTVYEWIIHLTLITTILFLPVSYSNSFILSLLMLSEVVKFSLYKISMGRNRIHPILPRIDIIQIKEQLAPFARKSLIHLKITIAIAPAYFILPITTFTVFYLIIIWIAAGIYITHRLLFAKTDSFRFQNNQTILRSCFTFIIFGSLFSLLWTLSGYFLLLKLSIPIIPQASIMIPAFIILLSIFYNIPNEYLLIRLYEERKLDLLNAFIISVQVGISYLIISTRNIELCVWMISLSSILYSLRLGYLSNKLV